MSGLFALQVLGDSVGSRQAVTVTEERQEEGKQLKEGFGYLMRSTEFTAFFILYIVYSYFLVAELKFPCKIKKNTILTINS